MTKVEEQVCGALITLMKEKNYDKIKVAELTRAAEISRSTFYVYFDSVLDVLQLIEDDFLSNLEDEKDAYTEMGISAKTIRNFSYVRDHMDIFEVLLGEHGDPYFALRVGNRLKRVFSTMATDKKSTLSPTQLTMVNEFSKAGKMQIFRWWSEHKDDVSVKEVIEMLEKLEFAIREIVKGR